MVSKKYEDLTSYNKLILIDLGKEYVVPGFVNVSTSITRDIQVDKVQGNNNGGIKDNGRKNASITFDLTGDLDDYQEFIDKILPLINSKNNESKVFTLKNSVINDVGIYQGVFVSADIDQPIGNEFQLKMTFAEYAPPIPVKKTSTGLSAKTKSNGKEIADGIISAMKLGVSKLGLKNKEYGQEPYGMSIADKRYSNNPYLGKKSSYYQAANSDKPLQSNTYSNEIDYLTGKKSDEEYLIGT